MNKWVCDTGRLLSSPRSHSPLNNWIQNQTKQTRKQKPQPLLKKLSKINQNSHARGTIRISSILNSQTHLMATMANHQLHIDLLRTTEHSMTQYTSSH